MKKSVAFDEEVARRAMAIAGKGGFSAFVNEAVAQRLQAKRFEQLYAELEREFGPVPDDIKREVETEWDLAMAELGRNHGW